MPQASEANADGAERADRVAILSAVSFFDAKTWNENQVPVRCSGGRVVSAHGCVSGTDMSPVRRITVATAPLRLLAGVQASW